MGVQWDLVLKFIGKNGNTDNAQNQAIKKWLPPL